MNVFQRKKENLEWETLQHVIGQYIYMSPIKLSPNITEFTLCALKVVPVTTYITQQCGGTP